MLVIPPDMVEQ
jgi:hypothetical protein